MSNLGNFLIPGAQSLIKYAERLTKDIPQEIFASKPLDQSGELLEMTHPAFNFGHLCCYPKKILGLIDQELKSTEVPEIYYQSFVKGSICHHDPDLKIYPHKSEMMDLFFKGYAEVLELVANVDQSVLENVNPWPDSVDRFPTVGAFLCFLMSGHIAGHLGQISSWRRCFKLGSV